MRFSIERIPVEVSIAATMLALMFALSAYYGAPIVFPDSGSAKFVGIHYIYPLAGIAALGVILKRLGERQIVSRYFLASACYAVVLFVHFNVKLWIPHINPYQFDALYWRIDNFARPLVDLCMLLRESLVWLIPYDVNFYMLSFIGLFYCSFFYHALKTPDKFANLVVAVLLLQSFGTLAYLVAPAIGPFVYEPGVNPLITASQQSMYEFYLRSVAEGPAWIAHHGADGFTIGLAAMPSLHTAGAFLFALFAWRHGRVLVPLYSFLLLFITVAAVANRWHYLIDIPAGAALAWISLRVADLVAPAATSEAEAERQPDAMPATSAASA